jgi:predicted cobalt transporter CbtA
VLRRFDPARLRSVLAAAVLLGIAGGVAASVLDTVTAEPSIEAAIRIEESHQAPGGPHEPGGPGVSPVQKEMVSRSTQRGVGRFGAYALAGAAFGVIFGVAFFALRRRHPDAFTRALLVGAILAGTLTVSPWLKYPPNPPAVGDPATLAERQRLYFALILITGVVLFGASHLWARLRDAGWVRDQRVAMALAAVAVPLAAVYALMPPPPDPITVPAVLVWRFRLASLAGNLLLWAVLTVGFALLAAARERATGASRQPARPGWQIPAS